MKILVVTQYFWPENFKINDLCKTLLGRGYDVTVYTGLPNYPQGRFYEGYSFFGTYSESYEGVRVIRVPMLSRGVSSKLRLFLNYISYFLSASLLVPFVVRGKYDKIFVYAPSPVTVIIPGIILRFLKKAPVFVWILDPWPETLEAVGVIKNRFILKLIGDFVSFLYRFCDAILVPSRGYVDGIRRLKVPAKKIFYFPQWAEDLFTLDRSSESKSLPVPDDNFKIIFAGNIGTAQGFETILEAAKSLKDKKVSFIILGDGVLRSWVEKEVSKNRLESNFILLGKKPLDEMPAFYDKADVLLLSLKKTPQFLKTVPAKLQSYMASGKPILAVVEGESTNIIKEAKSGVVVSPGSSKELELAILELMTKSKKDLAEMGTNARNYYQQNFNKENQMRLLEKIFKEI